MSSIGERLRQERLRLGLSLEQIAKQTRIHARHLEAIEADDYDRIPGRFFARSFLRQYARSVGLDESQLEGEMEKLTASERLPFQEDPARPKPRIAIPSLPLASRPRDARVRRPLVALAGFLAIMFACSGLYYLWQRAEKRPQTAKVETKARTPRVVPPAATPTPSEPAPAALPAPPPTETATSGTATHPAVEPPPAAAATAPVRTPPSAAPETPRPTLPAAGRIVVEVTVQEPVWMEVRADGKVIFSATLRGGQSRAFTGNQAVRMLTGNAGGMEVRYNGQSTGEVGRRGDVRVIEFTPENFRVLPPKKPEPATPDPV